MARKLSYDQEKVKELRMSIVEASLRVMADDPVVEKWSPYKKELILRLAGTALPRVNEHSGPDGAPIPLLNVLSNHNSDEEDTQSDETH